MKEKRFKDDNPMDNFVVKIWEGVEARKKANSLWPRKDWTENVELLELMSDGEYIINSDPFSKLPPINHRS